MKTIFYIEIKTAPDGLNGVIVHPGAKSASLQDIIDQAEIMGYRLTQFSGWDEPSSRRKMIQNLDNICDLMSALEIRRVKGASPDQQKWPIDYPLIEDINWPALAASVGRSWP